MALSSFSPITEPAWNYKDYAQNPRVLPVPNLIQVQLNSFEWLQTLGIRELLDEISPIEDLTGGKFELHFGVHEFQDPKYSAEECRAKEVTYEGALYVTVRLVFKESGEIKEQKLFMGNIPLMTDKGTYIINGAERVVVSQLVRSPGVYFTETKDPSTGRILCYAKLIPYRGAWLEFETNNRDLIHVKVDRKRKASVTTLLRALGYSSDEEILEIFKDVEDGKDRKFITATLERDTPAQTVDEALLDFYRRLKPGEPPSLANAKLMMENLFFNPRRYDLGKVGRYKINKRLHLDISESTRTLTKEDFIKLIKAMIEVNNGSTGDDIDHLGNRRVRAVGELIQNQLRIGLLRMERVVKERMTIIDPERATPSALTNIRPVAASIKEFFGGSQLSQFMDQTNPLAELTHKRRLSALGPGGLNRERAGFDVRDVHHSHYGRICPIETPEGPNIGLLGSLATYAKTNAYGFIETPYRKVLKSLKNNNDDLIGRTLAQDVLTKDGKKLAGRGMVITKELKQQIVRLQSQDIRVTPYLSDNEQDVVYMSADDEEQFIIGQANSKIGEKNQLEEAYLEARKKDEFIVESADNVDFLDVSPMQMVSVSTSLIPFLEHDDANRALMGSNMQRQAVPLLLPDAPLVGTGMEARVALDSGQVVLAKAEGVVVSSTSKEIIVEDKDGKTYSHPLIKFLRSNQGTCITQRPIVYKGDRVKLGNPLADSSSTDRGNLALGQNVLVAFMSWEGYNYEDAIIISERLVRDDKFTSIHIEKHEVEARDTKLGQEEITRDIPNVGDESLRNLDEDGIICIGAEVVAGDILVGKITPKGETELTAEEKLLRAIFGEKARDVKDTSLRVPHGEKGKVIDVKIISRESKSDLSAGVNKLVRVWIAQTRKVSEGDKMAGRHGNKGVISKILPIEDMPYLPDGTPVDIILNPIGVPSRMNLGQVLETHLGWAAKKMNFRVKSPVFDSAQDIDIDDALAKLWIYQESGAMDSESGSINKEQVNAWLAEYGMTETILTESGPKGTLRDSALAIWLKQRSIPVPKESSELYEKALQLARENTREAPPIFGKSVLYDGRNGERFDQPVTVGYVYMMKLIHLVEDKIHARSTGPYSLITQQPLGGKAQFGGQRFGEMEVWALEAYSAAYNLQEMLTVKSDDVVGRVKTYEAVVKGEDIASPGIPESFHVLVKELQSLGLAVELLRDPVPGAQDLSVSSASQDTGQSLLETEGGGSDASESLEEALSADLDAKDDESIKSILDKPENDELPANTEEGGADDAD
jgi:DNA-directed RNA polymerase subunit beta